MADVEDNVFIFSGMFDNTCSTVRKIFAISPGIVEPFATPVVGFTEIVVKVERILV